MIDVRILECFSESCHQNLKEFWEIISSVNEEYSLDLRKSEKFRKKIGKMEYKDFETLYSILSKLLLKGKQNLHFHKCQTRLVEISPICKELQDIWWKCCLYLKIQLYITIIFWRVSKEPLIYFYVTHVKITISIKVLASED